MNDKKQVSPIKEAQSLEKKCDSGERPEATGSPSEPSTPVQSPASSLVGTSASGVNSEDVLQKFEKLRTQHLDLAAKQQYMDERVTKLEASRQQDEVPSKAKQMRVPEQNAMTSLGNVLSSEPARTSGESDGKHIEKDAASIKTSSKYDKEEWVVSTLSLTQKGLKETAKQLEAIQGREEKLQQTVADTTEVVRTMMEDQKQMRKDQIALQQTVADTTKVVWTMMEDQKQMQNVQTADRKRIGQNERDIQDLSDKVERMSSTSSANSSFTASSPVMGSGSWVQPICATFQQADMETCEAVSDKDELVVHVLASQSDPGPLKRHSLESKQKQSASAAEPSLEDKMLEEFKKVGATQERILHALQHKEQVASSSSGSDHEAPVVAEPEEETEPCSSKSAPPHIPTL